MELMIRIKIATSTMTGSITPNFLHHHVRHRMIWIFYCQSLRRMTPTPKETIILSLTPTPTQRRTLMKHPNHAVTRIPKGKMTRKGELQFFDW